MTVVLEILVFSFAAKFLLTPLPLPQVDFVGETESKPFTDSGRGSLQDSNIYLYISIQIYREVGLLPLCPMLHDTYISCLRFLCFRVLSRAHLWLFQ
jgi:hypothetical protein